MPGRISRPRSFAVICSMQVSQPTPLTWLPSGMFLSTCPTRGEHSWRRRAWRDRGATLVVSLPDPNSLEARVFGKYWAGWDIPRHFYLWPHSALTRLLAECGWEPEGSICLRGRHWLLALSLRFWLQDQGVIVQRLGRYVPRFIESLPARVLLWPYFRSGGADWPWFNYGRLCSQEGVDWRVRNSPCDRYALPEAGI